MNLKYLGHSCFQLAIGDSHIVFDPYIRGNALASDAGIDIDQVRADYILVSHGHDDHTGDLVYMAEKTDALVISAWEIYAWLTRQGYTKGHPMNIGGRKDLGFAKVRMTYASHSSSMGDGTYAGAAAGFLIEAEGKKIYYSGDTALNLEMKLLGETHRIDLAILPIGDNFTMGYEDAAKAAEFLKCDKVIGMHYDTFDLIKTDKAAATSHFKSVGRELKLMKIGELIVI